MKKIIYLFVLFATHLTANEILVNKDTPVFLKPDTHSTMVSVVNEPTMIKYTEIKSTQQIFKSLCRHVDFYKIPYQQTNLWIAPDVQVESLTKVGYKIVYQHNQAFLYVSVGCAILFGLLLYYYFTGLKKKWIKRRYSRYILPGLLVILHFAILFQVLYLARGQLRYPLDEFAFFNVSKGIINWNFSPQWSMTVGMPLVYIPFITVFRASNMFDIVLPVCVFFGCVLMPASIVMVFFIARKLTASIHGAFFAAVLWMLLNVTYFPVESNMSTSVFSLFGGVIGEYIATCYLFIRTGFNSMSSNLSMFTLFGAVTLALYMKPRFRMFAIVSAIYGFSCITRINNVFFAPLIAWLFWRQGQTLFADRKYLLKSVVVSLAAFMAVFSLQLIANQLNFGSILTFPYSLHSTEVYKGFEFKNLKYGINYYFRIHYFFFAAAMASLAAMRNRNLRAALIFWTMPLTIFFCGYCILGQPIRFLLPVFSGLCIAIACPGIRHGLIKQQKLLLVLTVVILALPLLPFKFQVEKLPGAFVNYISRLYLLRLMAGPALWLYLLYNLRRQRPALIFILIYGVLIFAGSPYLLFACCVIALIYAVWTFCFEIISDLRGAVKL